MSKEDKRLEEAYQIVDALDEQMAEPSYHAFVQAKAMASLMEKDGDFVPDPEFQENETHVAPVRKSQRKKQQTYTFTSGQYITSSPELTPERTQDEQMEDLEKNISKVDKRSDTTSPTTENSTTDIDDAAPFYTCKEAFMGGRPMSKIALTPSNTDARSIRERIQDVIDNMKIEQEKRQRQWRIRMGEQVPTPKEDRTEEEQDSDSYVPPEMDLSGWTIGARADVLDPAAAPDPNLKLLSAKKKVKEKENEKDSDGFDFQDSPAATQLEILPPRAKIQPMDVEGTKSEKGRKRAPKKAASKKKSTKSGTSGKKGAVKKKAATKKKPAQKRGKVSALNKYGKKRKTDVQVRKIKGMTGVYTRGNNRYFTTGRAPGGKNKYIGSFETAKEAGEAYDKYIFEYKGHDYDNYNFPDQLPPKV